MRRLCCLSWLAFSVGFLGALGCRPQQPHFLFEDGDLSHYVGEATDIEYPDAEVNSLDEVAIDGQNNRPLTLQHPETTSFWNLTLERAVQIALANSKVMRTVGGQVLTAPETLTRSPDFAGSVYDPALAESDPRFGPEAALSAFDAQLSTSVFWSRGDRPQNFEAIPGEIGGFFLPVAINDTGSFTSSISKTNVTGGTTSIAHNVDYEYSNSGIRKWPSDWYAELVAEFRQPLLQGAGAQFNRIAGPGAQPGSYNGVVLARINTDIQLADFEAAVRDLVLDVERAYWQLSLAYHQLETAKEGRDSMLETWRVVKTKYEFGAQEGDASQESQVREQYFLFHSLVQDSLNRVYTVENNLRYLMGIAATDGRLIRPADDPTTAKITFPWDQVHYEALVRSVELRRQRWRVKQREMELIAAKNFLLPRLDAVAQYRWLGLGDDLAATERYDGNDTTAYQSLTGGRFQEWRFGLELSLPIGFRRELAGVRNAQLALARARAVLQDEELEVSHQLAQSVRNLESSYELMRTNYSRLQAAKYNADVIKIRLDEGMPEIFVYLESLRRLSESKADFYQSLLAYNESIAAVHYRKGSLLEYNGVFLAEGPWPAKAYFDATRRARERDAAIFMDYGFTRPRVISRGPYQQHTGATKGSEIEPREVKPETTGTTPEPIPTPAPEPMSAGPGAGFQASRLPGGSPRGREAPGMAIAVGRELQFAPGVEAAPGRSRKVDTTVRPVSFEEPAAATPSGWNLRPVENSTSEPRHEPLSRLPSDPTARPASGWKPVQR